jgi:hypothetical protein
MFDLEATIRDWRTRTKAAGAADSTLDELEDHLREEFKSRTHAGASNEGAWSAAVAALGDPSALHREFAKIESLPMLDRAALTVLLAMSAITGATSVMLMMNNGERLRVDPLLSIHVATITFGYLAGIFAAIIAAYGTLRSYFSRVRTPALTTVTLRIIRVASIAAASFTLVGFALGAVWAYGEWGTAFRSDVREIGAMIVIATFCAAALTAGRQSKLARTSLAFALLAGAAVVAAWFGAAAHAANYPPALTIPTAIAVIGTVGLAALALHPRHDLSIT